MKCKTYLKDGWIKRKYYEEIYDDQGNLVAEEVIGASMVRNGFAVNLPTAEEIVEELENE